jgi:hypothetical protein
MITIFMVSTQLLERRKYKTPLQLSKRPTGKGTNPKNFKPSDKVARVHLSS